MDFRNRTALGTNPLYRWTNAQEYRALMVDEGLAHCFNMYDVVRIDHFRGFDEYYAIPYGDKTAERGWWEKGPGMDLFPHRFPETGTKRHYCRGSWLYDRFCEASCGGERISQYEGNREFRF